MTFLSSFYGWNMWIKIRDYPDSRFLDFRNATRVNPVSVNSERMEDLEGRKAGISKGRHWGMI